jgi:hypothetical protein
MTSNNGIYGGTCVGYCAKLQLLEKENRADG